MADRRKYNRTYRARTRIIEFNDREAAELHSDASHKCTMKRHNARRLPLANARQIMLIGSETNDGNSRVTHVTQRGAIWRTMRRENGPIPFDPRQLKAFQTERRPDVLIILTAYHCCTRAAIVGRSRVNLDGLSATSTF